MNQNKQNENMKLMPVKELNYTNDLKMLLTGATLQLLIFCTFCTKNWVSITECWPLLQSWFNIKFHTVCIRQLPDLIFEIPHRSWFYLGFCLAD